MRFNVLLKDGNFHPTIALEHETPSNNESIPLNVLEAQCTKLDYKWGENSGKIHHRFHKHRFRSIAEDRLAGRCRKERRTSVSEEVGVIPQTYWYAFHVNLYTEKGESTVM